MLLVSGHFGDPVAEELREAGVPLVACGKPFGLGSKVSYVAADDRDGARDMVRHLLSLGRRRIGVVTGPLDTPGDVERLAGYKEVLAEAGIGVDESLIVPGDYSRASGEAGAERLLARAPDVDAVFVASDLMAQGVVRKPLSGPVQRRRSRGTASATRWCGCCWRRSAARIRQR